VDVFLEKILDAEAKRLVKEVPRHLLSGSCLPRGETFNGRGGGGGRNRAGRVSRSGPNNAPTTCSWYGRIWIFRADGSAERNARQIAPSMIYTTKP